MDTEELRKQFANLLANTEMPNHLTQEEKIALYQPLHNLINTNIPKSLFRFRSCNEMNFDAFHNDKIFAVSPKLFNDPCDTLVYVDKKFITRNVDYELSLQFWLDLQDYIQKYNDLPVNFIQIPDIKRRELINRVKNSTIEELNQLSKSKQEIQELKSNINGMIDRKIDIISKIYFVACFAEEIKQPLMWSHYSDSHKGFALEYDFSDGYTHNCANCNAEKRKECPSNIDTNLYPVIYSDKRFDATKWVGTQISADLQKEMNWEPTMKNHVDILFWNKASLYKSLHWEYEKEWRLNCFLSSNMQSATLCVSAKPPKAIYYGSNISEINKKLLRLLVKQKQESGMNIEEYDMFVEKDQKSFILSHKKI